MVWSRCPHGVFMVASQCCHGVAMVCYSVIMMRSQCHHSMVAVSPWCGHSDVTYSHDMTQQARSLMNICKGQLLCVVGSRHYSLAMYQSCAGHCVLGTGCHPYCGAVHILIFGGLCRCLSACISRQCFHSVGVWCLASALC